MASFAYQTSKAAATHLGKMLSSVLPQVTSRASYNHCTTNRDSQFNIRSNIIAPGFFPSGKSFRRALTIKDVHLHTEMSNAVIDTNGPVSPDFIPMRRYGSEDDISGLTLYLASKAGAYVNGNVSVVDGGRLGLGSSTY